jgi:aspartate kinase
LSKQVVADLVSPLREDWSRGRQLVTEGFVGATADGAITTLGRGGSDYTAAVLGAAVGAREVEIWTDVGGVMTSDPRRVGVARWVPRLSYGEAAELSYFGAKVLHPDTVHPAVECGIPLRVLNTLHPEHPGTIIDSEGDHGVPVKAITSKSRVIAITIESGRMLGAHGFMRRVFEAFDRHRVSVDVVATAEVSLTITMDPHPALPALITELEEVATVKVAEGRGILTLVGEGIRFAPNLCQRVFAALEGINVELISMGASRLNLSIVIEGHQLEGALRSIHRAIFEEEA